MPYHVTRLRLQLELSTRTAASRLSLIAHRLSGRGFRALIAYGLLFPVDEEVVFIDEDEAVAADALGDGG